MIWDSESLTFKSRTTNLSAQIVPHPLFTRLHINTLQYRDPKDSTPIKQNQWWNVTWIKSWGKKEYSQKLTATTKTIQASWNKELPEVKAAITQKKPKLLWASGTGTPSMQWLQYRIKAHRLPTWSVSEKGRCSKCPGHQLDNIGHIFWTCHKYLWELLVWIWSGKKQTLNKHWQQALLSGKMFQPPAGLHSVGTKEIFQHLPFWGKLWGLLTSATFSIIWTLRNQRVHEGTLPRRQLHGVWFLKQIASRLRQLRSHDITNWKLYTSLLKNALKLPYYPSPPVTTYLQAFFDGGSRQNPGIGGAGSWCLQKHNTIVSLQLQSVRPFEPITNNEAEALALLQIILSSIGRNLIPQCTCVDIRGDSNILIQGLNGRNRIRNKKLAPIFLQIQYLLSLFQDWTATHTKRHGNKVADYLANLAMDTTEKPRLEYKKLLTHIRNDLRELPSSQSLTDVPRPWSKNAELDLTNPGTIESLLPALLPLQVTSARREAKKECLTFPFRVTLWRSHVQEVSIQESERLGLKPAGIG